MKRLTYFYTNILIVLLCVGAILIALYAQYAMHLSPCPLCIFQRVGVLGVGLVTLFAVLHRPHSWVRKIYAVAGMLMALFGLGVAMRQVWLQSLPAASRPACGPGLNYLLQELPLHRALAIVFAGTGDCGVVHIRVLGLSMAGWSVVFFALLLVLLIWQFVRRV